VTKSEGAMAKVYKLFWGGGDRLPQAGVGAALKEVASIATTRVKNSVSTNMPSFALTY